MSLAQKLILYALAVALLPMSAIGFSLIRVGEGALRTRIQEHQQTAAVAVAAKVSQAVEELASHIASVVGRFELTQLSRAERDGLAKLLYRQSLDITAVLLRDIEGKPLAPLISQATGDGTIGHVPSTEEELATFAKALPKVTEQDRSGTILMSAVYFPAGGPARVAVAVPCCGGAPTAVAGVEIALRQEVLRIEGVDTGQDSSIFVVDSGGRVILHPTLPTGAELASHGAVAAILAGKARGAVRVDGTGEAPAMAAAYAKVGNLGWGVVVEQPEGIAFASARAMRTQILAWTLGTILVVLLSGFIFAGRLRRTLGIMVAGARAFGDGRLAERIEIGRGDEIGELAETMNSMAEELRRSLQELEEWNRTLEVKVAERTEELKQAQAQLLTQSKLAAIGQLGAGVAHEVNNPLAGILGYTQLLIRKHPEGDPERDTLKKIEAAAQRCKSITVNLLRFSERGLAGRTQTVINDVVHEVLDAFRIPFEEAGVQVVEELAPALPAIQANSGQLAVVLINILSNSKNAMVDGGVLTITTAAARDGVSLSVGDTGCGIEEQHLPRIFEPFFTTKKVWTGVGLGLSVAYRVVEDHGGHIEAESIEGAGTTIKIWLPFVPPEEVAEPSLHKAVLLD